MEAIATTQYQFRTVLYSLIKSHLNIDEMHMLLSMDDILASFSKLGEWKESSQLL
jgi:hypothetical protein